jgi:hypothetical protein
MAVMRGQLIILRSGSGQYDLVVKRDYREISSGTSHFLAENRIPWQHSYINIYWCSVIAREAREPHSLKSKMMSI